MRAGRWIVRFLVAVAIVAGLCSGNAQAAGKKEFAGVGLQVVPTSTGELAVLAVIGDSPAEKAGIKPGDLIIAVDGYPLRGSDFTEVVQERLWGPVGSASTLTFLRPGTAGVLREDVQRIPLQGVSPAQVPGVRMLAPGEAVSPRGKN